jgi:hypothetical protein
LFTAEDSYSEERQALMDDLAIRAEQWIRASSMAVRFDEVSLHPIILRPQHGCPNQVFTNIMFDDEQMRVANQGVLLRLNARMRHHQVRVPDEHESERCSTAKV